MKGCCLCTDASVLFMFPILAEGPILKNFAKHTRRHKGVSVPWQHDAFQPAFWVWVSETQLLQNTHTHTLTHSHTNACLCMQIQNTSGLTITDVNTDLQINILHSK